MLRRHSPVRAASRQPRLSACSVGFAILILSGSVRADASGPLQAIPSTNSIAPLNLAAPPQCETAFYTDVSLNNGALGNDLSVVTTSVCGNESRPFRWYRGAWSPLPMPDVAPGQGGWAASVSDDNRGQPTVTLVVGDDFYWDVWVSTAGQTPVKLASLDGASHPIWAMVTAAGGHVVGEVEGNLDVFDIRAVRWARNGQGWSVPEEIAPGLVEAVSADGRVVVGEDPYESRQAWVWTETAEGGAVQYLGEEISVEDITHDGQVIVGSRRERCRTAECPRIDYDRPLYWTLEDGVWQQHGLERPDGIALDTSVWASAVARVGESVIIVGNSNHAWEDGTLHSLAWIPGDDGEYGAPVLLEPIGGDAESPVVVFDINRQGVAAGWSYELPIDNHPEVTLWQVVDAPAQNLNTGYSGAWYNPNIPGQGLMMDVRPDDRFVFLSWFTFTETGEPHWFTAQGNFAGSEASLTLYETAGGRFNVPWPTSTSVVGELMLNFSDCAHGSVVYRLDSWDLAGEFPIQRLIPGSEDRCGQISGYSGQSIDIDSSLVGAWYDPKIPGQGFMIDVQTDPQTGNFLFLSWMTFGDDADLGQPWLTAQGAFEGQSATLEAFVTSGGVFDRATPIEIVGVGQITLEFDDCGGGSLTWSIRRLGEDTNELIRLLPRGESLCAAPPNR